MLRSQSPIACRASSLILALSASIAAAQSVPFTTSFTTGNNWGTSGQGIYAQGFSPSEVPNPNPGLQSGDTVLLDRFQFFRSGFPETSTNIRLAIINNYFFNLQTFTTTSFEITYGTAPNQVYALSTNTIASAAAIATGAAITFNFNHIPLVYGNDYAAVFVNEGPGGALTPVRVSSLIANYVETSPGSNEFVPTADYGDVEADYFKAASNTINTDTFGSFFDVFKPAHADALFVASFNLPPQDYDHSGAWGDGDFTRWKTQFGQLGAGLDADGDLDGDVDGSDFLYWQQRYGAPAAIAAAGSIPEPRGLALAALAFILAFPRRRLA